MPCPHVRCLSVSLSLCLSLCLAASVSVSVSRCDGVGIGVDVSVWYRCRCRRVCVYACMSGCVFVRVRVFARVFARVCAVRVRVCRARVRVVVGSCVRLMPACPCACRSGWTALLFAWANPSVLVRVSVACSHASRRVHAVCADARVQSDSSATHSTLTVVVTSSLSYCALRRPAVSSALPPVLLATALLNRSRRLPCIAV
jgi:hypothetical protein